MECKHMYEDGTPAVTLEDGELRCSLCGEKFSIGETEIRSLIKMSTKLKDDDIKVYFTSHESYYYFYNADECGVHDDVYIDGAIQEMSDGKLFTHFQFVLIIKKDNVMNEVKKLVIIVKSDDNTLDQTSSPKIIMYLSPSVLDLLL